MKTNATAFFTWMDHSYPYRNRNHRGDILYAKSKYDDMFLAEELLEIYTQQIMKENVRRETEEDIRVNVSSAKDKTEADELTRKLKRAFVSGFSIGYNSSVNDIDNVDELFDKWMSIIDKNRISYTQKIKTLIDAICEKHGLPQPITVPAAGRMIAEYEGYFQAIELFEGAVRETDSIFKSSAYKATLETILKRNND